LWSTTRYLQCVWTDQLSLAVSSRRGQRAGSAGHSAAHPWGCLPHFRPFQKQVALCRRGCMGQALPAGRVPANLSLQRDSVRQRCRRSGGTAVPSPSNLRRVALLHLSSLGLRSSPALYNPSTLARRCSPAGCCSASRAPNASRRARAQRAGLTTPEARERAGRVRRPDTPSHMPHRVPTAGHPPLPLTNPPALAALSPSHSLPRPRPPQRAGDCSKATMSSTAATAVAGGDDAGSVDHLPDALLSQVLAAVGREDG